jgi:hypothetical protein
MQRTSPILSAVFQMVYTPDKKSSGQFKDSGERGKGGREREDGTVCIIWNSDEIENVETIVLETPRGLAQLMLVF